MVLLVVATRLLLRERDDEHPVHVCDAERRVALRQLWVGESARRDAGAPRRVEDVDVSADEIRRVELRAAWRRREREALVDRSRPLNPHDGVVRGDGRIPAADRPGLAREDEPRGSGLPSLLTTKPLPPLKTVPVGRR
jgi:hypothetical protein